MKKSLGQFLILLIIIACYANLIQCSYLSVMKSNIHYVKQNKDEDNYKFIELNNKVKNETATNEESFDGVEPKDKDPEVEKEERFERYVKSMSKQCSDKDCGNQLRQLKNEFNIDFPEIENFETKERDLEKENKQFEDHVKLMGKKLMSASELNDRNNKIDEFEKQGLSETEMQEEFKKIDENADENAQAQKKKKDEKNKKMAKRINGQKTEIEIKQEILDKGTLNTGVYGVYKMQKRMWYFNKQLKYGKDFSNVYVNLNDKRLFDYKVKLPVFMKEIEVYLQCNFQIQGSYRPQSGYKARLFLGQNAIGQASKTEDMRTISSPPNNYISENAILAGKVYNVPAGEHVISLFVDRIGNTSYRFMDNYERVDATLNITGFPNY